MQLEILPFQRLCGVFCYAFAALWLRLSCALAAPLLFLWRANSTTKISRSWLRFWQRLRGALATLLLRLWQRLCYAFAASLLRLCGVFATLLAAPLWRLCYACGAFLRRVCCAFGASVAAPWLRLCGVFAAALLRFCCAVGALLARHVGALLDDVDSLPHTIRFLSKFVLRR